VGIIASKLIFNVNTLILFYYLDTMIVDNCSIVDCNVIDMFNDAWYYKIDDFIVNF
jgi:hypothetical protein